MYVPKFNWESETWQTWHRHVSRGSNHYVISHLKLKASYKLFTQINTIIMSVCEERVVANNTDGGLFHGVPANLIVQDIWDNCFLDPQDAC